MLYKFLIIKCFRVCGTADRQARARRRIGLSALLALTACATAPIPLNSERIERQFGSYAVRVLEASGNERVTSLESRQDGRSVTRTLALVSFDDTDHGPFAREHGRIVQGESIGRTFRDAGWTIDKPILFIGELTVTGRAATVGRLMNLPLPATLAMHAYRLEVARGGLEYSYATIVELHHPGYLGVEDLRRLYGDRRAVPEFDAAALKRRVRERLSGLSDVTRLFSVPRRFRPSGTACRGACPATRRCCRA